MDCIVCYKQCQNRKSTREQAHLFVCGQQQRTGGLQEGKQGPKVEEMLLISNFNLCTKL